MLKDLLINQITDCIKAGIVILNSNNETVFWNKWMESASGLTSAEVLNKNFFDLMPRAKNSRLEQAVENALKLKQSAFISHTINLQLLPLFKKNLRTESVNEIIHNIRIFPLKDEKQNSFVFLNITDETEYFEKERILRQKAYDEKKLNLNLQREIEERLHIEQKLRLSASIIENTKEAVLITEQNAKITFVNPAFTEITGYTPLEAVGRKVSVLKSGKHDSQYYAKMWDSLVSAGSWRGEFINKKPDGSLYTVESSIFSIKDESKQITHYVNIFHDITLRKEGEEKLKEMSTIDSLTGLYNRRIFSETYDRIYKSCMRNKEPLSLAFLDVDFFKLYNDIYGHQKGDICLKKIADMVKKNIKRPDDIAARFGGEEFIALLPYTDSKGAFQIMEDVREAVLQLKIPHEKSSVEKYVSISIGIATLTPAKVISKEKLLELADKAMYKAKNEGRNRVLCA
ncbi:MAG: diguanylate cyclase [Spirochaetia bacterium]|nr:diguanylate cyclase [Spirochaetia bacterium]